MLEYSGRCSMGCGKWACTMSSMSCRHITCDRRYRHAVEWLGAPWGHAVAPSTPVAGLPLHVARLAAPFRGAFSGWRPWRGCAGFSPSEMALPNHPDVAYEFVQDPARMRLCRGCWCRSTPSSCPTTDRAREQKHLPHRLVCRNSARRLRATSSPSSRRKAATPSWSARCSPTTRRRACRAVELGGNSVPPLVTQIADGENGGVMMNEFPPQVFRCLARVRPDPTRRW